MLKLSWNLWMQLRAPEELFQKLLPSVCSTLVSVLLNLLNFSQAIHRYCGSVLRVQRWTQTFRTQTFCCGMNQRPQKTVTKFRIIFQTPWNILKKEISRTELINHLLYQADRRNAHNTKCINTSTRLKYEFQSLHNFNFSEKEQDDIQKLRSFKKKTDHQVPYELLMCYSVI